MPQIFYLGPSFDFMKSRKNNHAKITKIFPFFVVPQLYIFLGNRLTKTTNYNFFVIKTRFV